MATRQSIEERFWSKVDRNGPVPGHRPELGQCWIWTSGKWKFGYGQFKRHGKRLVAHRIAWGMSNGLIPGETPYVLHACDNPSCVRPDHLWLGTKADNNRDRSAKGRSATGSRSGARLHPESTVRGELVNTAKMTADGVRLLRSLHASGTPVHTLMARFGLSKAQVHRIARRQHWAHVAQEGDSYRARESGSRDCAGRELRQHLEERAEG